MTFPLQDERIKHLVVLMLENRSFDHMLGLLKAEIPEIRGLAPAAYSNPTAARTTASSWRRS